MRIFRFLHLLLLFGCTSGFAQIVDDTTHEVYGRHSTKYFLQEDVYFGKGKERSLDTSLNYQQNYNYQYSNNTVYQYLGNLGTAMKLLYYKAPEEIGYRLGFEAFHPYLNSIKNQKYYDTKSPYSELKYLQGSTGEQHLFISLARNVNRYWNIGGSYNRLTSTKQFAVVQQRDFQTDHQQINAFTSVKTKREKYIVLVNFNYMQHWNYESGGIKLQPNNGGVSDSGLYLYKYANVRLFRDNASAARNYYRTTNLHLYHQFNPLDSGNNLLQFFHEADWKRENQYFRDNNMVVDNAFKTYYGGVNFQDTVMSFYQYHYEMFQNKVGLKGYTNKFFYSMYYKTRAYSIVESSQDTSASGKQTRWFKDSYCGGDFAFRPTDNLTISFSGQGLMSFKSVTNPNDTNYKSYNDYQWNGSVRYKKFSLEAGQSRTSPTLMQSRMVYNLANWSHNKDSLNAVLSSNATFTYLHTKGNRYFKLGLHYQRIDNLVYFRSPEKGADSLKVSPVQDKGYIDYVQPTIGFRTNWRWLYLENELILTNVFTDKEIIHMPRWFTMPKLYYQSFFFKKATQVQAGVELFLKADYYADGYAPQLNQYFWQDKYLVKTFPITNLFLNFQISSATVFLKLTNA